jgi:hypothetical protein
MNSQKVGRFTSLRVITLLFLLSFCSVYAEEKLNLAVAEFEARNVSPMDASAISDLIRTELISQNAFRVIDRKNMETILIEHQFQISGCNSQVCAIQIGKLLNVNKVVIGTFSKLFDAYYVTVITASEIPL